MATDLFGIFYHMSSFKSIDIVFEVGTYHSWPNTLPFRVGYWGANTRTPKSDPSTRSSPNFDSFEVLYIHGRLPDIFNISIANSLHYAYITFQKLGIAWGTLNPQGWIEGCPQICINFYNSATIEFRALKFIVLKFSIDLTTGVDLRGVYNLKMCFSWLRRAAFIRYIT